MPEGGGGARERADVDDVTDETTLAVSDADAIRLCKVGKDDVEGTRSVDIAQGDTGGRKSAGAHVAAGEAPVAVTQAHAAELVEVGKHRIEVGVGVDESKRNCRARARVVAHVLTAVEAAGAVAEADAVGSVRSIREHRVELAIVVHVADGDRVAGKRVRAHIRTGEVTGAVAEADAVVLK